MIRRLSVLALVACCLAACSSEEPAPAEPAGEISKDAITPSVLIVLSGKDHVTAEDGSKHPTGFWLEELVVPYSLFREEGFTITVATPTGARPTMDPASKDAGGENPEQLQRALALADEALATVVSLADLDAEQRAGFHAVFVPGGHAPMEDLASDAEMGKLLALCHEQEKPTALVCHGVIALLSTRDGDAFPYAGYKLTGFTNAEEAQSHLAEHLRFTPQDALSEAGAVFETAPDWTSHVVEDRELITGQNPASSEAIAEALIKRISK